MPKGIILPAPDDDVAFVDAETGGAAGGVATRARSEIAMVLGPLLERPGGLKDGAIYVLSIKSFREHLGERWPRVAPKIYDAVDHLIADEITGSDTHTRFGADCYLVAFGRDSEASAAVKIAIIAKRIREKLFGEGTSLDVEIHALGAGAPTIAPTAASAPAAPAPAPASAKAAPQAEGGDGPVTYGFIPVWDAAHKVLSTYISMPTRTLRSGRVRFSHEILPPNASDYERAEFDKASFDYLMDVADDMARNRFAVLLGFGLHYNSLSPGKGRELLLNAFRRIPDNLRNVIKIQILGAPDQVPNSTLSDRVALIRPYFRAVLMQIRTVEQDMSRFAYTGLHALVYRWWESGGDVQAHLDQCRSAIARAKAVRVFLGFGGVPNAQIASELAGAGATYLWGPFLGETLDMPANMRRMTLTDLGRQNAAKPMSDSRVVAV